MSDRTPPKVELHLHLDCSLSYDAIRQLNPSVTLDDYRREYIAPARCADLAELLSGEPKVLRLLQSRDALVLMVKDVFRQLERDGVLYAELRFAPLLHLEDGLTAERVVDEVDAAVDRMVRATGIEARLILCTLRHFTERESLETAQLVHAFRDRRVVALDLAGDEAAFALQPHVAAYRFVHDHGLNTTAHAGEARGAESVWETLRELAPARIGHGVRSSEDPELLAHLRQSRVHLEVCLSSNIQTMPALRAIAEHPVDKLRRSGVSLSINTDTRMLTPTTLTREYALLQEHFNWDAGTLLACNSDALRYAFVDEVTKAALLARLTSHWMS